MLLTSSAGGELFFSQAGKTVWTEFPCTKLAKSFSQPVNLPRAQPMQQHTLEITRQRRSSNLSSSSRKRIRRIRRSKIKEDEKRFHTVLLHVDIVKIIWSYVNIYIMFDPQNVTNLSLFPALGKSFLWSWKRAWFFHIWECLKQRKTEHIALYIYRHVHVQWKEYGSKGFFAFNNGCPIKKDYTVLCLSEEQCFGIWIKLLSHNFLRVVAMP